MTVNPILLVGGAGALGQAMIDRWPDNLPPPIVWDVAIPDPVSGTRVDLCDADAVARAAEKLPARLHVLHLAARLDVSDEPDIVRGSIMNNIGALVVPASVLATRVAILTQISSVSVYDSETPSPLPETAKPAPRTAYGAGKAAAEVTGAALARIWGWNHCIIRPTQLFGLRSADQSLPHLLMHRAMAAETLKLSADPDTLRDYLHVDDAVALILDQCREPREGIYNLGAANPVSLGAMFEVASRRWGVPVVTTQPVGARYDQYLDMTSTRAAFAFDARHSVLDWLATATP